MNGPDSRRRAAARRAREPAPRDQDFRAGYRSAWADAWRQAQDLCAEAFDAGFEAAEADEEADEVPEAEAEPSGDYLDGLRDSEAVIVRLRARIRQLEATARDAR